MVQLHTPIKTSSIQHGTGVKMWNPKTDCFQCKGKFTNPIKIVFFNGFEETTLNFCSFNCIRENLKCKPETIE